MVGIHIDGMGLAEMSCYVAFGWVEKVYWILKRLVDKDWLGKQSSIIIAWIVVGQVAIFDENVGIVIIVTDWTGLLE